MITPAGSSAALFSDVIRTIDCSCLTESTIHSDTTRIVVTLNPHGGLSNRLRLTLGFWYVASLTNATLVIVWKKDVGCNLYFQDIYQPIPRTFFVGTATELKPIVSRAKQHGDIVLDVKLANSNTLQRVVEIYDHDKRAWLHQQPNGELGSLRGDLIFRLYQLLRPVPRLQLQIDTFATATNISSCVGFHIRRTDLTSHPKSSFWKRLNQVKTNASKDTIAFGSLAGKTGTFTVNDLDNAFFEKVRNGIKQAKSQRFFLATDNPDTQLKFERAAEFPNGTIFAFGEIPRARHNIPALSNRRYTTLDRAVIDAHLLARCRELHGTPGSSYTTLAWNLNRAFVSGWGVLS